MSLADELQRTSRALQRGTRLATRRAVAAGIEALREAGVGALAPRIGSSVPLFALPDGAGVVRHLASFLAHGPVVVSFFRGAWCPFCATELRALQAVVPAVRRLGADILAVTPQTVPQVRELVCGRQLSFTVLSDVGNDVARAWGLAFRLPPMLQRVYRDDFGIDLDCFNGDHRHELPVAATFVLDRDGVVVDRHVDPDYTQRMEPGRVVDCLRELARDSARLLKAHDGGA